jgi:hypothetical protein
MPNMPKNPKDGLAAELSLPGGEELPAEDFYYEGPYVVFTSAYHLKRGYCCNSDCRHCPYRDAGESE